MKKKGNRGGCVRRRKMARRWEGQIQEMRQTEEGNHSGSLVVLGEEIDIPIC